MQATAGDSRASTEQASLRAAQEKTWSKSEVAQHETKETRDKAGCHEVTQAQSHNQPGRNH